MTLVVAGGCSTAPRDIGDGGLDRAAYDPPAVATLAGMSEEATGFEQGNGNGNGNGHFTDLRVMSVNMGRRYKPHELSYMAEYVEAGCKRLPDFMLCQEVSFRRDADEPSAITVAKRLGLHCRATRRYSDREGLGIMSRYPFDYYGDIQLDARTSAYMFGHGRASIMAEFIVPDVGRVRVVNVHLANWGWESHIRQQQIRETMRWIVERDRKVPAEVTFFGGDFNSPPGSDAIAAVTRPGAAGTLEFEDHNTDRSTRGGNRAKNRLDYIFMAAPDGGVDMVNERILDEIEHEGQVYDFWISGHSPLLHVYDVAAPVAEE